MKTKLLLLTLITLIITASNVFASTITITGYGENNEKVKQDVTNKAIERITKEVFHDNVPSDVSFDGIESVIEYSNLIMQGSSNSEYRYRMLGTIDTDKVVKFLSEKAQPQNDEVPIKAEDENVNTDEQHIETTATAQNENVISMGSNSASIYEGSSSQNNYISNSNVEENKNSDDATMSDFMADYEKRQEALNKLQEERRRDEAALREKEARVVRLSWGVGLNVFFPINSNSENIVVSNRLAPTVNIGMVIKNRLIISLGASPTFAQRNQKEPKLSLGMGYYRTYLDLNVSYKADWNSTFLYIGVGAGLDVDSAKEIYIMPQVAFALNFDKFRPVFDSAEAKIAVRYTFSTKIWDLGVEFTLKGLY